MSSSAILWIIICVIMVVTETATLQLISIWFAGGALLAFAASFFLSFEWQFAIFAFSSFIFLICTMPFIRKFKNQKYIPTNYDIDIGKTVTVTETIDRKNNSGRAVLNDVSWLAVSENENDIIQKGENVVIKDIKGAKLIVSRK